MIFNDHSRLTGKHAFLSASKHHWLGYDDEKLALVFENSQASQRGVELHALAHDMIRLKVKLAKSKNSFNRYVNDGIGYRMTTEQILYFSDNAYGTADTISFREDLLRIHDLKTGVTPSSMHQLEIYAALFCLEYAYKPDDIQIQLRIYQGYEVLEHIPEPEEIQTIMQKFVRFDRLINELRIQNET